MLLLAQEMHRILNDYNAPAGYRAQLRCGLHIGNLTGP